MLPGTVFWRAGHHVNRAGWWWAWRWAPAPHGDDVVRSGRCWADHTRKVNRLPVLWCGRILEMGLTKKYQNLKTFDKYSVSQSLRVVGAPINKIINISSRGGLKVEQWSDNRTLSRWINPRLRHAYYMVPMDPLWDKGVRDTKTRK